MSIVLDRSRVAEVNKSARLPPLSYQDCPILFETIMFSNPNSPSLDELSKKKKNAQKILKYL